MSNKRQRIAESATFPEAARRAALREIALDTEPELLAELMRRGYRWQDVLTSNVKSTSFERACSHEVMRSNREFSPSTEYSLFVPWESLGYGTRSSLSVTGGAANGGNLVETEIFDKSPVEPLRPSSVLLGNGASVIVSNKNNVALPRIYAPPLAGSGETATVSVGVTGFTSEVTNLNAIWYSSQIQVSNQVIAQAADREIEAYIVKLLRDSIGKLIDNLAINGTGQTNGVGQALGLLNMQENSPGSFDPGMLVPDFSFANATAYANVCTAIRNLDSANFEDSLTDRVFLLSPASRENWAGIPLSSGNSNFLYDHKTGKVLQYRASVSNQLAQTNQSILIDMREPIFLFVGSGFECTIDKFTYAGSNQTLITVGFLADFSMYRGGASVSSGPTNNGM